MTGRIGGSGPARAVAIEPGQPVPALETGQVVTAAVESVQGREAVLRLMGMLLRARAEVPLFPGEVLELFVASAGPDHLHLRRLDPAAAGGRAAPPEPGAANATDPAGGTTAGGTAAGGSASGAGALEQLAARALAAYRQPLDPGAVERLARLIAATPESQRELAASAGAWLLSVGDAPAAAALRELAGAAAGPRPFSLRQRLLALAEAMESAADHTADGALATRLRSAAAELRSWGWHGVRPGAAAQGGSTARSAAPQPTAGGQGPAPGPAGSPAPAGGATSGAAAAGTTAAGAPAPPAATPAGTGSDPPGAAGAMPNPAGSAQSPTAPRSATPHPAPAPGPEPGAAGQPGPAQRHLPEMLADAARTLESLPPEGREAAQTALRDAHALLGGLRRLSGALAGDGETTWAVYPLPFTQGHLEGEALLLRRRRGSRTATGEEEPDELHLYFATPHLGPLAVHLSWHRGAVGATLTATSPEAAGALATALPRLAGALQEQGLQVSALRTAVGPADPPPVFRSPAPAPPRGLDRKL